MNNIEFETFVIEYEDLQTALIDYLRKIGEIEDHEQVGVMDFPVELDEDGSIEFDVEIISAS